MVYSRIWARKGRKGRMGESRENQHEKVQICLGTGDLRAQWGVPWLLWHRVKRQNSSWEVLWLPPSRKGMWEKSQHPPGGPMERKNRKEKGSKGEVLRERKKERITTEIYYYCIILLLDYEWGLHCVASSTNSSQTKIISAWDHQCLSRGFKQP